jgi:hypothetical protein
MSKVVRKKAAKKKTSGRKRTTSKATVAKKRKAPAKRSKAIVRQKSVSRKTAKPGNNSSGKRSPQKQMLRDAFGMATEGLNGFDAGDLRMARRNLKFLVDLLAEC